jgi:hypothetical protein
MRIAIGAAMGEYWELYWVILGEVYNKLGTG